MYGTLNKNLRVICPQIQVFIIWLKTITAQFPLSSSACFYKENGNNICRTQKRISGNAGVARAHQTLAGQLTLSQPGRANYVPTSHIWPSQILGPSYGPEDHHNMAARRHCRRRVLFCKMQVRPWSYRSYPLSTARNNFGAKDNCIYRG